MENQLEYKGNELSLFIHSLNWKNYFTLKLSPFIKGNVLEVGAGIGGSTIHLLNKYCLGWTCLEPDANLCKQILVQLNQNQLKNICTIICGNIQDLNPAIQYDAIIYIDVLEHIEDDKNELRTAYNFLQPGGNLIVLSPAYMYLYSDFDSAIGHYRRYTLKNLKEVFPSGILFKKTVYLDSMGVFTSLLNKWFLKQQYPHFKQIKFWDKYLIPLSKIMDKLFFYRFGRSVLVIAQKQ